MTEPFDLTAILDIVDIGGDCFLGRSPRQERGRVFGGLVIAQALTAAMRTTVDRLPHSLHAYFLRPGDASKPLLYEIERLKDGRSFSARRCLVRQDDAVLCTLSASFHSEEPGLEHSPPMPATPEPEDLETIQSVAERTAPSLGRALERFFGPDRPVDIRPVDPTRYDANEERRRPASQAFWIRYRQPLPDDRRIHMSILAYISDMTLLDAALVPHRRIVFDPSLQVASLDHALWFHRSFRADSWLLYAQDSPTAVGGRGFSRGLLFSRDGALVASVAQEGLLRPITPAKA